MKIKLVDIESYYKNTIVETDDRVPSQAMRVKSLLEKVIRKLPNEEQFKIKGWIEIGQNDLVTLFLRRVDSELGFGDPRRLLVKDGKLMPWFHQNPNESTFLITLVTDKLNDKSDDYIVGLIASLFSEFSLLWKTQYGDVKNYWKMGQKARERAFERNRKTIVGFAREQYRILVDAEAERLGFSEELLAYDNPATIPSP